MPKDVIFIKDEPGKGRGTAAGSLAALAKHARQGTAGRNNRGKNLNKLKEGQMEFHKYITGKCFSKLQLGRLMSAMATMPIKTIEKIAEDRDKYPVLMVTIARGLCSENEVFRLNTVHLMMQRMAGKVTEDLEKLEELKDKEITIVIQPPQDTKTQEIGERIEEI